MPADRTAEPTAQPITPAFLRARPLPEPGGSKEARGHALVIGGSAGTPGAVLLAGQAALRVGAGVLGMALPDEIAIPVAVAVPESGVCPWTLDRHGHLDNASRERLAQRIEWADAVLVGPGLDDGELTTHLLQLVAELAADKLPIALDAYGIGALRDVDEETRNRLRGRTLVTPNHREAGMLLDTEIDVDSDDDLEVAQRISATWDAVVAYQGSVSAPGRTPLASSTGDSGLGTSGSGDVLAGALLGLLARGADAELAAAWAGYLHAAAGDRLAARIGRLGYLAGELLDELPQVLSELSG